MSKVALKKYLNTLQKGEIIEMVLDLYDARKEAKEYLEYYLNPNEKEKLKEYKTIILNEFFPKRGDRKCRFSVCRKAIADFRKLYPAPENLADLMLYLVENACEAADLWGDLWESFYDSTESNFEATMKFITKNGLLPKFQKRIEAALKNKKVAAMVFVMPCRTSTRNMQETIATNPNHYG